jgi:hypothetical protein
MAMLVSPILQEYIGQTQPMQQVKQAKDRTMRHYLIYSDGLRHYFGDL